MIFDFALEPELVATWWDPRVAYPILCQMGVGQRRVPCMFPAARWRRLVMDALQEGVAGATSAEGQSARKKMEILLQHLHQFATQRNGRLMGEEAWLTAATREHSDFPFGGILVRTSAAERPEVVAADRLAVEEHPAWCPPTPPVLRQPIELAEALGPLLRSARQLRFVDPYFDPEDGTYFDPMRAYLTVAQRRRSVGDLQLQIHFAVRPDQVEQASGLAGRQLKEDDVARERVGACARRLAPLLKANVSVRVFGWGAAASGKRMHNRYVLSEVGGIAVQSGLDQSPRGSRQTDDLTILSREQYQVRWAEYSPEGAAYRRLADGRFVGATIAGS